MNPGVTNEQGERLELVVTTTNEPTTVIFVHGFGTDKDEGGQLFIDLSAAIAPIAKTVRFSFSGYGKSEGRQEDVTLGKMAGDLQAVIHWTNEQFGGRKIILAHSMGGLVTSFLCPTGIERSIFTGLPRPDTHDTIANIQRRILSRPGGVLDPDGISIYPRTHGPIQKIGPGFWPSLAAADIIDCMKRYALQTELTLIKPMQDDVTGPSEINSPYRQISGAHYIEMDGNHGFSYKRHRAKLIKTIKQIIEEP